MVKSRPWILGLASSHNGAACLLHGDEIAVAIQEERLLRFKRAEHPVGFSSLSIKYCLDHAGITAKDLDAVVVCSTAATKSRYHDVFLNPQLQVAGHDTKVFVIPHHYGHAIACHMLSGYRSSAVLVIDGNGSPLDELLDEEKAVMLPAQLEAARTRGRGIVRENISLYVACEDVLRPIEKHVGSYAICAERQPGLQEFQSLGDMYGYVGAQIFGSFFEGPGKVMGLAPYGKPAIPVEEFLTLTPQGIVFHDTVRRRFRHDEHWPNRKEEYENLAASVQRALETAVLWLCSRFKDASENLCYAGGVALNSVANERIVRETGFQNVFIMPAAEDSGTAIGAAYFGLRQLCGYSRIQQQKLDSVGRSYDESSILNGMKRVPGIALSRSPDVVEQTARLLSEGKIVGWFQGGSELGPRALGQRSILCDPRSPQMKDVLNERVKFREGFRPFAPIILKEDVYDWFDVDPPYGESPFMLRVLPFREEKRNAVPAVVHVDGTGRVQTVSKEFTPELHRLLRTFKELTGIPVLLNTSFNIAGEPIVETPDDALWCFLYTDMDYCVLNDYLVSKLVGSPDLLDLPLSICAHSFALYGKQQKGSVDLPSLMLSDASDLALSAHFSRIEELGTAANRYDWMKLLIIVNTPWGEAIHGVSGALLNILTAINGVRTGREIYLDITTRTTASRDRNGNPVEISYSISKFRRHLALLKRIGAIQFLPQRQVVAEGVEQNQRRFSAPLAV